MLKRLCWHSVRPFCTQDSQGHYMVLKGNLIFINIESFHFHFIVFHWTRGMRFSVHIMTFQSPSWLSYSMTDSFTSKRLPRETWLHLASFLDTESLLALSNSVSFLGWLKPRLCKLVIPKHRFLQTDSTSTLLEAKPYGNLREISVNYIFEEKPRNQVFFRVVILHSKGEGMDVH